MFLKVTLGFTIVLLALFEQECFVRPSSIQCSRVHVFVAPGTCVELTNPCADNLWKAGDTFTIEETFPAGNTPQGIKIETNRSQPIPTREVCATNTLPVVDQHVSYEYQTGLNRGGEVIVLTVPDGAVLAATATANPATIDVGGTSQLSANVRGGNAPYSYVWLPVSSLNVPAIANPVANPTITTTYFLSVTDSAGSNVMAQVIVNVRFTLTTLLSPSTIEPGGSSQLNANARGGTPPYTYAWSPSSTLTSSDDFDTIASPTSTTTYTVAVTDSVGDQLTDSVTVTVNAPPPTPTPTPTPAPTPTPTGADLAVTISDSADPVPGTGPLTMTFLVTNNGPLTATNVRMSYPLPLGTELSSNFFPSQGTCSLSLSNILTCNFGTIASGNSATLPLPIFSLSLGLMTSTATVIGNEIDPDMSNNTDTETTTVGP